MSLKGFWFDAQLFSKTGQACLSRKGVRLTRDTVARPLSSAQTMQVAGGCSNPRGCLTRDRGVAVVTLRQPALTDFNDRQMTGFVPYRHSQ